MAEKNNEILWKLTKCKSCAKQNLQLATRNEDGMGWDGMDGYQAVLFVL